MVGGWWGGSFDCVKDRYKYMFAHQEPNPKKEEEEEEEEMQQEKKKKKKNQKKNIL